MTDRAALEAVTALLADAHARRVFPAAVAEVGTSDGAAWQAAIGTLAFDVPVPAGPATIFDLASLTKPIATLSAVLDLVAEARVRLDAPVAAFFPEWRGADREQATVQDLLEHASGLSARLLDRPPADRRAFEHDICTMPLEYAPRSRALYSDLGFILLGFLSERVSGRTLAAQAEATLTSSASGDRLLTGIDPAQRDRCAPTEPLAADERRGRRLVGEVHDDYAARLGGLAGHAGLFGTAPAVGAFARQILAAVRGRPSSLPLSAALVRRSMTRSTVPGSSRALGWDTMLPTSSCGTRLSASACGHVGFTGTSLWLDPDRDRYYVLLTNRVCGGGTSDEMQQVRRAFHDLAAAGA